VTSNTHQILSRAAICLLLATTGSASVVSSDSIITYAPVPESILTPDSVETRLGGFEFFDGYPSPETVEAAYDNLDARRCRLSPDDRRRDLSLSHS